MFDPTEFVAGGERYHVVRYCRTDYMQGSPLIERLNPLRYEIGIGKRPNRFIWNRHGRLAVKWSNLTYRAVRKPLRKLIEHIMQIAGGK